MRDKVTAPAIASMKGQRIVCVTAYDYPSALLCDGAGVDLILVGDSLGNVVLGYENTLPVSLDEMAHHVAAVARARPKALLVADMPFGSYQVSATGAVTSAVQLVKSGAEAVKLEGTYVDSIRAIRGAGIPVMGHVGMTPQSVNAFGGFRVQGRGEHGDEVASAACAVADAGVFAMVLEVIPALLAARITKEVPVPTIGIGAGPQCDGEIQVFHDILGLLPGEPYKHTKRFADGGEIFEKAIAEYAQQVRARTFPNESNSF